MHDFVLKLYTNAQVFCLGWNSEGKRLASGSLDRSVRVTRVDASCGVRAPALSAAVSSMCLRQTLAEHYSPQPGVC